MTLHYRYIVYFDSKAGQWRLEDPLENGVFNPENTEFLELDNTYTGLYNELSLLIGEMNE